MAPTGEACGTVLNGAYRLCKTSPYRATAKTRPPAVRSSNALDDNVVRTRQNEINRQRPGQGHEALEVVHVGMFHVGNVGRRSSRAPIAGNDEDALGRLAELPRQSVLAAPLSDEKHSHN
ncbi:hypothetical protein HYQ46_003694 [Verticillium longisporum]|nr:hypothetical protein HYQ46_003694 [Verticillium longisporum]